MATAADSNAYGGGAGGKFRKRPAKRPQTAPYDRPATALRNAWRNNDNNGGGGGGWLSRIVDPASKLISASAHRLFSSVFRKRLLPSPQPSPDEKVEHAENHHGDAATDGRSSIQQGDGNEGNTQNHGSVVVDGVAELEQILKKKTFTRSEFDRLTVLLHSRTVDNAGIAGTSRFESTPSEPPAGQSRQHLDGIATQNGAYPSEAPGAYSTPAVRSKVNDDDIASPAQLAKAYMGSRSTRSPSIAEPRSHTLRDETRALTPFQSHGPLVSAVQKPLTSAGPPHNNFVIPRSRGRSAIYSMARTPYSRVPPTALKGPGTSNNDFDEQSLSSQKALKRRSSALENDIGVGPIRRIRQKSNLHYSKALALPSSRTSLTSRAPSEVGEASLYSSPKPKEDNGDRVMPGSSSHISSKSMEMGQRILQQLEKMTPPKEKSSEKKLSFSTGMPGMELTPAMLHGKARKSLETGNSLNYLQSGQASGKSVNPLDAAVNEVQASTPKQPDKVYDSNGKPMNISNEVHPENIEARTSGSDVFGVSNNSDPVTLKSAVEVPKKSRAFQMSAYEDYLELDDDAPLNGDALNEGGTKLESSFVQSNGNVLHDNRPLLEPAKVDKHPAFSELSSSSNLVLKKDNAVKSSTPAENGFGHTFSTELVSDKKIGLSTPSLKPATTSSDKSDIPASSFSFGLKTSDKASLTPLSSSAVESSTPKDVKPVSPGSGYAFGTGANDAAFKSPESSNKANAAVDLLKRSDDTSSFAVPANASGVSSLGSGFTTSSTPSPLLFSTQSSPGGISTESSFTAPATSASVSATKVTVTADTATATASSTNNGPAGSVAFPSLQSSHASGVSATALDSTIVAASGGDTQSTKGMAFGNSISSSFSGASFSTTPSSAVPTFNFGASTSSGTGNSQSPTTTGSASATQTGLSSLAGNSGDNQLGSSASVSAPFSSSTAFVSSLSPASAVSAPVTTSSASSSIFGANWQPNSSPVFGSALSNASSGPSFGASSASTPSVSASSGFTFGSNSVAAPVSGSSAGALFGAPTSTTTGGSSSESSGFSFGASSSSTITNSVAPGFSFGSTSVTPPTNGSSPSTGSAASVFGFGSSTSASSSAPSSTFAFGAAPASASASSSALSSTFSFGASSASSTSFSSPSTAFSFGASSTPAAATPASPFSFGASSTPAPGPVFSFGSAASTPPSTAPQPSQPTFGNGGSVFGFGSTPTPSPLGNNNDQMSMEDTMADDSMQSPATQAPTPSPVFGQTPTTNFGFGMAQAPAPAGANPFQFGGQPSQSAAPQNPFQAGQLAAPQNPFQNSGSFDGGSFSLGAGGGTDKSTRKFIKAKGRNRKK